MNDIAKQWFPEDPWKDEHKKILEEQRQKRLRGETLTFRKCLNILKFLSQSPRSRGIMFTYIWPGVLVGCSAVIISFTMSAGQTQSAGGGTMQSVAMQCLAYSLAFCLIATAAVCVRIGWRNTNPIGKYLTGAYAVAIIFWLIGRGTGAEWGDFGTLCGIWLACLVVSSLIAGAIWLYGLLHRV